MDARKILHLAAAIYGAPGKLPTPSRDAKALAGGERLRDALERLAFGIDSDLSFDCGGN